MTRTLVFDDAVKVPWSCGFSDGCGHGWHMATYWIDDDGVVVDRYGDWGDYEREDALPSEEEIERGWTDYYRYVSETGLDPCEAFSSPGPRKVKRKWQAMLRHWIGSKEYGLRVLGVRRNARGKWLTPVEDSESIPTEVYDYLFLGAEWYKPGSKDCKACHSCIGSYIPSIEALKILLGDSARILGDLRAVVTFEVEEMAGGWSAERIAQWLKTAARKELRGLTGGAK